MIVLECPARFEGDPTDVSAPWRMFLGGGITGCPDWQKEMIARFKDVDNVQIFNPRRANFDITNPDMSHEQIVWEYQHLWISDVVLFWFPYHTMCPITLYELGVYAAKGAKIIVGCHPAYQRKDDVRIQLSLLRPDVQVHDNFGDMVAEFNAWLEDGKQM